MPIPATFGLGVSQQRFHDILQQLGLSVDASRISVALRNINMLHEYVQFYPSWDKGGWCSCCLTGCRDLACPSLTLRVRRVAALIILTTAAPRPCYLSSHAVYDATFEG
jgi:hypothetical protein